MSGGYLDWIRVPDFDNVYLAGRHFEVFLEAETGGLSWEPAQAVFAAPTHGGSHMIVRRYRGEAAPLVVTYYSLTTGLLADNEDDVKAVKRAGAQGGPVYFVCGGLRCWEEFEAEAGGSYKLTRPLALGIADFVAELTHPTEIYLDGVRNDAAADVAGRAVSANATGRIGVWYVPAFLVLIQASDVLQDVNLWTISLRLDEVTVGFAG